MSDKVNRGNPHARNGKATRRVRGTFSVRLSPEERERIERAAKREYRGIGNFIVSRVIASLDAEEAEA